MNEIKRVYFVRHGQTEGNLGKFFQSDDTELSEAGHKGGRAVAERFKNLEVDILVASGFTRAQQTAGYISKVIDLPVTTVESFHELLRPFEIRGKLHSSEEGANHREEYKTEYYSKDWNPEGSENYYNVIQRAAESVDYLEKSPSQNIVVVSHADFLRSIFAFLLLNKEDNVDVYKSVFKGFKQMSNVGITEYRYEEGKWQLFMYNDHAHFAE